MYFFILLVPFSVIYYEVHYSYKRLCFIHNFSFFDHLCNYYLKVLFIFLWLALALLCFLLLFSSLCLILWPIYLNLRVIIWICNRYRRLLSLWANIWNCRFWFIRLCIFLLWSVWLLNVLLFLFVFQFLFWRSLIVHLFTFRYFIVL